MADSIVARLRARQAEWEASEAKGGLRELPVGQKFPMVIKKATIAPTNNKDHDQVTWELQVTDGDYKGTMAWKRSSLKTAMNIDFFKGDLKAINVEPPAKFDDLGATLVNECEGVHVLVGVRQGKDKDGTPNEFVNYDFKERLEGTEQVAETPKTAKKTKKKLAPKPELDREAVIQMGKDDNADALQKVIDDNGLGIDQDDYATYGEVADLIINQLDL